MKLLETQYDAINNQIYLFCDNITQDGLNYLVELFNNDDISSNISLWYEEPYISEYSFLWKEYPVIVIWFDNDYWYGVETYKQLDYIKKWDDIENIFYDKAIDDRIAFNKREQDPNLAKCSICSSHDKKSIIKYYNNMCKRCFEERIPR